MQMQPLQQPPATWCVRLPAGAAAVAAALAQSEIETRRWYLPPLNEHPAFAGVRCIGPGGSERLPVTEDLATALPGLPFHSRLGEQDVASMVSAMANAIGACGSN